MPTSNVVFVVWLDATTHCTYDFVRAELERIEHAEAHPCQLVQGTVCPTNHVQEGGLAMNGTPNGIIASSESFRHANKSRDVAAAAAAGSGWTRMFLASTREYAVRFMGFASLYNELAATHANHGK